MRKQYHFRAGERGWDAWDVDHLIERTAGAPVESVDLKRIVEIDQTYWHDAVGDRPTVRNHVEHMRLTLAADLRYPIVLAWDGRVVDGMHRVARALLEGRSSIDAVRLPEPIPPDFVDGRPEDLSY